MPRSTLCWSAALFFEACVSFNSAWAATPTLVTTNNTPALPPDGIPPITVTGQRELPPTGSVTLLSPQEVALRRPASALDLTAMAPNLLAFQGTGDHLPQFSVRGLRDNNLGVGEPQVVLYVDDVPYDDVFTRGVPLYGLDAVELFRGPQGTQFGASRPGGVMDVHTPLPGDAWHGAASVSYGNYDAWRTEVALSGAVITNTLQVGVAGLYFRRDGFVHNTFTGTDGDTRETLAGRVKARWTPTERLEFLFTASGHRFDDGLQPGVPLGSQDYYTVTRNLNGYDRMQAHTESLRTTYTSDAFNVVSITAHSGWHESLLQDSDYLPFDIAASAFVRDQDQWSQEFRVESTDALSAWQWSGGAYGAWKNFNSDVAANFATPPPNTLPFPFTSRTRQFNDNEDFALFGQVTRALGESFETTAGLRLEYAARDANGSQSTESGGVPIAPPTLFNGSDNFSSVQPKVELAWKPTPKSRVWLGVTRGFQPGGVSFSAAPAPTSFADSDSWHYELGAGTELAGGKVTVRSAVFYTDVQDYQIFRPTGFGNFAMLNADRAHTLGAELELTVRPTEHWEVALRGGVVRAKFDDFTDASNGAALDDKDINFVPRYTVDGTLTWHPGRNFFAQAGGQLIGPFWFDENNTTRQDAYGLLNARAGWDNGHWGCAVYGRNVLDQHYVANAIHFNQPGLGDFFVVTPGEPAMYGIELFAKF